MRRVGQNQSAHQIRPDGGQALRDHAADRQADDDSLPDAPLVHERRQIADMVGHGVRRWRRFRQAMAALVIADDTMVVGEERRDLVPDAEIRAERIRKHQRRLVAATVLEMQNHAIGAQEIHAGTPPCPETYY